MPMVALDDATPTTWPRTRILVETVNIGTRVRHEDGA